MRMRRVPHNIQNKVIKWFDYLWLTQKSSDEEKAVSCLPGKVPPSLSNKAWANSALSDSICGPIETVESVS